MAGRAREMAEPYPDHYSERLRSEDRLLGSLVSCGRLVIGSGRMPAGPTAANLTEGEVCLSN